MPFATLKTRARLQWQDRPRSAQQRSAYKIAAKHEPSLARAVRRYFNDLRSDEAIDALERAMRFSTTAAQAVEAMPWQAAEERLLTSMQRVLANVVEESGRAEGRRGVEVPERVLKARVRYSFNLDNPYSLERIRRESAELVTEVSRSTKEGIRQVVERGYNEGKGAKAIADEVRETGIGLTSRDVQAVERAGERMFQGALRAGSTIREATAVAARMARDKHEKLLDRRVQNIARTETMRAQNDGVMDSWRQAQDDGLLMPQARKVWIASVPRVNERMCQICEELGTTYGPESGGIPLDAPFISAVNGQSYDRPIAHPSCFPAEALIATSGLRATAERWTEDELVVITTANKKRLACTPNHPILTPRGFVPAKLIHVSDHVVSCRGIELPLAIGQNDQDVPTSIKQVAHSFRESRPVTTVPVPTTAKHFHGDGKASKVAVVWADSLLLRDGKTSVIKHIPEVRFGGSRGAIGSLPHDRSFTELFEGRVTSAIGCVGCRSKSFAVLRAGLRHASKHALAAPARLDAVLKQPTADNLAAHAEGFAQRLLADASRVATEKVVDVNVVSFHGHVFNAETTSGAYVADGIVTSNCRCTLGLITTLPEET